MFLQLLFEFYSNPHSLYKARPLVVSAQGTDWVDDFVHLTEGYSVHELIEVIEVLFQPPVIHGIGFRKCFVEHGKNGVTISEAGRICLNMGF